MRVFPGGAFDAFVPVAPGENALEISARLPDGSRRELRRTVYFEQPERAHPGDTQRMQALLDELRRRTLETEHGLRPSEVEPDYRSLQLRVARDGEAVDTPAPDADPDQDTTPAR